VKEFIKQLGIHSASTDTGCAEKELPFKKKLQSAKVQQDKQSEKDPSSSGHAEKIVSETKKKTNKFRRDETATATIAARPVDPIVNYRPRKYLLVKPGGRWYADRVSDLSL